MRTLCVVWQIWQTRCKHGTQSHCPALKGQIFPLRQMLTCANYGIYIATCKLCGEQYVGQTSNKFSKRWNSHRSSWNAVNLSDDQQ